MPLDQVTVATQPPTFPLISNIIYMGVKVQSDTHYSSICWRVKEGFHSLEPLI